MFYLFTLRRPPLRKCVTNVTLRYDFRHKSRTPALHSEPNRSLHFSVTYLKTFPARVNMKRTLCMLTFKPALRWLLKPTVKTQLEGYLSLAVEASVLYFACLF